MTLAAGARIGSYEIAAPIGAGGMGEVFRARDTRLNRDVAIKVLPESLLKDPDALERFEREARAVAALSHPNILSIYDFGKSDGISYAVTELLEGETLRDKLDAGALPQRKAIEYAQQIAHGLAAAHDRGIVHRDLKPENVFVTHDGRVKILDFGLAKEGRRGKTADETSAPTATRHTDPGTVMGTVGYMSPEQVKGLPVDHRSDLFSFGAVLYEMLSGARAFRRDTPPETLTAILREEPPELSGSNPRIDPALDRLVRHCLEKSPEERFQSARDLGYALSSLSSASAVVSGGAARPGLRGGNHAVPGVLAGAAAGLLLGAVGMRLVQPRAAAPPRFRVLTYSGRDTHPSASPDGKTIAFASTRDGVSRIWIKQLAGGAEAVLTAGNDSFPRISPDGATVLFIRETEGTREAYRVPIVGGDARKIVGPADDADWSPDGREIAYNSSETRESKILSSLRRIGLDGTGQRVVAEVQDRLLIRPRWSPDGLTIAALESSGTGTSRLGIVLFPLDGTAKKTVDTSETGMSFALAWNGDSRGLILMGGGFVDGGNPIGSRTRTVFLKDTRGKTARMLFSAIDLRGLVDVAGRGSLVLGMGGPRSNLREISAKGGEAGRWLTRGNCVDRQPIFAPDGEWVAFTSNRYGSNDVWEVSRKTGAVRRLTDNAAEDFDPAFTRDGKHLIFTSNRSGHYEIWLAERDGNGARQVTNDGVDAENATGTPDGQWIVYASGNPDKRGIWKVRADGSQASRLVAGPVILAEVSPDGTLVSYLSPTETPKRVRVVRLSDGASVPCDITFRGRRGTSAGTTGRHRWMPDGRAFAIQVEDENGAFAVAIQDFAPGRDTNATRRLVTEFTTESSVQSFGVAPDGASLVVSAFEDSTTLLQADGVEGIVPRPAYGASR